MTEKTKPIFIVGSPRSGTSVLTWCLGQHPNILPLPETNWISKFAVDLGSTYDLGASRGQRSHLSAVGVSNAEFYETFGDAINDLILRYTVRHNLKQVDTAFQRIRSPLDPKKRWVDGTPEYSFYIAGLLKLFPNAKFIHILREVGSVVKSLMNFSHVGVVNYTEQAAYTYWLRTVRACVQAEEAFGSEKVLRIKHRDLISSPEQVLRSCLDFLNEPFCADCLKPLQQKINSSSVRPNFNAYDVNTDPHLRSEAEHFSEELLKEDNPVYEPNQQNIANLEKAFLDRTKFVGSLEADRREAIDALAKVQAELAELRKWALHQRIREVVRNTLPANATVVVVSKGDDEPLQLDGCQTWQFISDDVLQTADQKAEHASQTRDEKLESLFATGSQGTEQVPWIRAGQTYEFCLYAGMEHRERLATIQLMRSEKAFVTANWVQATGDRNVMTIMWNTGNGVAGQVYVAKKGEPESLFATGSQGTEQVPWIRAGQTYEFCLYAGMEHRERLAIIRLNWNKQSLLTLIPNPLSNAGNLEMAITWYTGDGSEGQVYVSEDSMVTNDSPADSTTAITDLEELRTRGADFLLFPSTALWWLDRHGVFREHLEGQYRMIMQQEDTCVIFALR